MADRDQLLDQVAAELWEYAHRPTTAGFSSTDHIKAILAPFLAAYDAAAPYKIPGPYEIAMALAPAFVAKGLDGPAAMGAAWAVVPEFYKARDWYVNEFAPMRMGLAMSPAEGVIHEHDDAEA